MPNYSALTSALRGGAAQQSEAPISAREGGAGHHPFLGPEFTNAALWGPTGNAYADRLDQVASYSVASTAPDGTPSVYRITYKDGTQQYEVAPSFAGKDGYNWAVVAPEGSTANMMERGVSDGGSGGSDHLSYTVSDPAAVQYQRYEPQGLDSTGDFFSVVAPLAIGFFAGPALTSALTSPLGATGASIASGAITGAASSAITGGDPLKGAVLGGVGGGVGSATSGWNPTGNAWADSAIRGATKGLTTGLLSGNPGAGVVSGATGGLLQTALPGNDFASSMARGAAQNVVTGALRGSPELEATNTASAAAGAANPGSTSTNAPGQLMDRGVMNQRQQLASQLRAL